MRRKSHLENLFSKRAFAALLLWFAVCLLASGAQQNQNNFCGSTTSGANENNFNNFPFSTTQCGSSGFTIISTFAGTGTQSSTGDGGPATAATLNEPSGIAFDAAGNVYLAENQGFRVRVVNMQATTQTLLGVSVGAGDIQTVAGTGTAGYTGDGGAAVSAEIANPAYLAFDSSGNLYIADQQNEAIRKVSTSGTITTFVGGAKGHAGIGYQGDNAPISFTLTSVAAASGGNTVYTGTFPVNVANGVNVYVQGFTNAANNGWYTTVGAITGGATTITLNNASGVAETHAALIMYSNFNTPQGLYIDVSNNVWIGDGLNGRVRVVNTQGSAQTFLGVSVPAGYINTVAGGAGNITLPELGYSGDGGAATSGKIAQITSINFDSSGNLYIADATNNVIRKVTTGTNVISTWAGQAGQTVISISAVSFSSPNTTYTYTVTSGPALVAGQSVQVGGCTSAGNNGYMQNITLGSGTFTAANATGVTESESGATGLAGTPGYAGDGGALSTSQFSSPQDIRFDSSGNAYIADAHNNLIRKVSGGNINTYAGNFSLYGTTGGYWGDGGLATSAGLFNPVYTVLDGSGNLYISDFKNNVVRKISPSTNPAILVGYGIAGLHGLTNQASPLTLDTVAANLLIAAVASFNANGTITDSQGGNSNSWTPLTTWTSASGTNERITIFYVLNPAHVGTNHTFTPGGSADASVAVYALQMPGTPSFDVQGGQSNLTTVTTFQPTVSGLTPTAGDVIVTAAGNATSSTSASIAGSGSDTAWLTPLRLVNGSDGGNIASILLNASGNSLNPTWTTNSASWGVAIAAFK